MNLQKINKNTASPRFNEESPIVRARHLNPLVDELNNTVETIEDNISSNASNIGVNTSEISALDAKIVTLEGNTTITEIITLDVFDIANTTVGSIGHVDGAIIKVTPSSDYFMEFISAVLIYDYDFAAYTGGSNDLKFQLGSSGTQVAVSSAISDANLTTAAGDKIVRVSSIPTELPITVGTTLSLAGTAYTAGTAVGKIYVHVTYRITETGL
jgi:hypothetical protein